MAQDWEIIEFWRKILEEFSEEEINELIIHENEYAEQYQEERPYLRIPLDDRYYKEPPKKEEYVDERGIAHISYEV